MSQTLKSLRLGVSPDLRLTSLSALQLPNLPVASGRSHRKAKKNVLKISSKTSSGFAEAIIPDLPGAKATATLKVALRKNDSDSIAFYALLERYNFKFEEFGIKLHIRSFLARSGLDGFIKDIKFTKPKSITTRTKLKSAKINPDEIFGYLHVDLELHFPVSTLRNGVITYPLHEALKTFSAQSAVMLSNIILTPPDLEPMNENKIGDACRDRKLILPKDWGYDSDNQMVLLNLGKKQYPIDASVILGSQLGNLLTDGKRMLARFQKAFDTPSTFIKQDYDVWGIDMSSPDDAAEFLLERETSNPNVFHVASPYLNLRTGSYSEFSGEETRHFELRTAEKAIPASNLLLHGRFFPIRKVSETISVTKIFPQTGSLDEELLKNKDVKEFFNLLVQHCGESTGKIRGMLIGKKGSFVLPYDQRSTIVSWATLAAKDGRHVDEHRLAEIDSKLLDTILTHPGNRIIQAALRGTVSHNKINLLFSSEFLTPDEIKDLSVNNSTGIGYFIANRLKLKSAASGKETSSGITALDLQHYQEIARSQDASIYWHQKNDKLRKLVGPFFVELQHEHTYRNMAFVLGIHLSHLSPNTFQGEELHQLQGFFEKLSATGMKIGIACGSSSETIQPLMNLVSKYPGLLGIGITSTFDETGKVGNPPVIAPCHDGDMDFSQSLFAQVTDIALILSGGIGTSSQAYDRISKMRFGLRTPAPVSLIEKSKFRVWNHLAAQLRKFVKFNSAEVWSPDTCSAFKDLGQYYDYLIKFIDNPLLWAEALQIPETILKESLKWHIETSRKLGRNPSSLFDVSYQKFGLNLPNASQ